MSISALALHTAIAAKELNSWLGFAPSTTYFYFDTVKYLCRSIPETDFPFLRRECAHLDIRTRFVKRRRHDGKLAIFSLYHPYTYRIEAQQPTDAFLSYFANRDDHVSRADLALDLVFDDEDQKSACQRYIVDHMAQPHQRANRPRIIFDNGGISTGARPKGYFIVAYDSKECRRDGQVNCVHVERRTLGTIALRNIGIEHPRDLIRFNHQALWTIMQSTCFLEIDLERLGRYHSNRHHRERRQSSLATQVMYAGRSRDHCIGSVIYRIYALDEAGERTIPQFIRQYGTGPFIKRGCSKASGSRNNEIGRADAQEGTA